MRRHDARLRNSPKELASDEAQWPPLYTSSLGDSLTNSMEAVASMETIASVGALALDTSPPQVVRLASGFPLYALQTSSIMGGVGGSGRGRM